MQENTKQAIALLGTMTGGFYDAYRLAGPSRSNDRQQIVSLAFGRKVPKANCGVNVIRQWLWDTVKPEGNCIAAMEHDCNAKLKAMGFDLHPNAII